MPSCRAPFTRHCHTWWPALTHYKHRFAWNHHWCTQEILRNPGNAGCSVLFVLNSFLQLWRTAECERDSKLCNTFKQLSQELHNVWSTSNCPDTPSPSRQSVMEVLECFQYGVGAVLSQHSSADNWLSALFSQHLSTAERIYNRNGCSVPSSQFVHASYAILIARISLSLML